MWRSANFYPWQSSLFLMGSLVLGHNNQLWPHYCGFFTTTNVVCETPNNNGEILISKWRGGGSIPNYEIFSLLVRKTKSPPTTRYYAVNPTPEPRGFLNRVGPTDSNLCRIARRCIIIIIITLLLFVFVLSLLLLLV